MRNRKGAEFLQGTPFRTIARNMIILGGNVLSLLKIERLAKNRRQNRRL